MPPLNRLLWWLVPIVALGLVLLTSYQAITSRRYDRANGITGELLAGSSIGQTFIARYANLSGVELHLGTYDPNPAPAKASLVLHLRAEAGNGPDLATAQMPAGAPLAHDPWYLFSFQPIADSQDRSFYIEVESPDGAPSKALTVYWWQPSPDGDAYPDGTAYLDGQPQPGDLTFGLHYEPSPLAAMAQVGRALSTNMPVAMMPLLFGGAAIGVWALIYLPIRLRDPDRRQRWLKRWSLPFVLGAAFINGLIYLLVVPPWQGPDEHTHFAYAALLDRYDLDSSKAQALYLQEQASDDRLAGVVRDAMARHDFTRLLLGSAAPGTPPDARATLFYSVRQPPLYYWLGALALRSGRWLGISADPYSDPDTALLVLRFVSLVLGLVVVALAWVAARLISAEGYSWLRLLLPLTIALLPMLTFDSTIANNDVLAEVAVSALFVTLAALLRWPTGRRGLALAALAVLLALLGVFTKSTATAAALPLLATGLVVWVGMLVTKALERRTERKGVAGNRMFVPGILGGLSLLLVVGALLLAYEPQERAAGWVLSRVPLWRMPRVETPTAHDGHYVLELGAQGQQAVMAFQVVVLPTYHPAMTMTVSGWVRAVPAAGPPLVAAPTAALKIEEGGFLMGRSDVFLDQSGEWQRISAMAHLIEGTQQIVLRITAEDERAQFDDFSMQLDDGPVAWHDPVFRTTLLNPSAESGTLGLRQFLVDRLPIEVTTAAEVLPNPQAFDVPALWLQYGREQYDTFWGSFGWESIPLSDIGYTLLGIIIVVSIAGLVVRAVRRWGQWTSLYWLGFSAILALVISMVAVFAWQTARLATQGVIGGLYGRYLFVLIIPIVWLLIAGLGGIVSLFRRSQPEQRDMEAAAGLPWAVWAWNIGLVVFAVYCLLTLIIPYYYA